MKQNLKKFNFAESAPTSPQPPEISENREGEVQHSRRSCGSCVTSSYPLPVLSASAPELEGMWTEVKRRVRTAQKIRERVSNLVVIMAFTRHLCHKAHRGKSVMFNV